MRQNLAIITLFLSALSYTEGIQQKNLQQTKTVSNIGGKVATTPKKEEASVNTAQSSNILANQTFQTFAQINNNLEVLEEQSRKNLVGLDAEITEDPIDEEVEADADATDENNVPDPPVTAAGAGGAGGGADAGASENTVQPASTPANLNDADAKCYSSRYQDIDAMLDPKSHYATVGIQQGRLGTCAKRLTDTEAQRLLNQNPDLQRMFGRGGPGSLQQARDYWQNVGYKNNAMAATVVDKDNIPFRCASSARDSCMCPGTLWFGASTRPDNGAKIDSFEEMREWRTVSADSEDWQSCSAIEFGSDPLPDVDKQCFCEVKPSYEATRCADEGDDCLCNGHVYFAPRYLSDHTTPAGFFDIMGDSFTLVDANGTGSVSCTSDTFEGADPIPEFAKQCFCDDRKQFTSNHEMYSIQDYYRSESMISSTESEISTVMSSQYEAEQSEYEYQEFYGGYDDYGGYGDADLAAAGCKMCDETCNADSDRSLQNEIERQKSILRRKYSKRREYNKYRKQTAYNKRVAGDNACTAAQRARDPVEKAKQRKLCYELRSESSRMTTEIDIESQNIDDQQKTEEKVLNEETTKVINEKTEKTVINQKTTEINTSKLKEETSERITKETDERISIIKKIIESEKITESIITKETTNIDKQITNINTQIEDIENQLTKELKEEREESIDSGSGSEVDETSIKVEKELTEEIKIKKEELITKNTSITNKINTHTSHINELTTNIDTITKEIVVIKYKIENVTISISSMFSQMEEYKNSIKITTSKEEKTKLQEQIDELTSKIKISKEELESLSSKREELITEETVSRTDLSYTSQTLKKEESYKSHIEEQIVVTDVVIKSKETKITEEQQKKEITTVQHNCFTKKLELSMKKEEFKQFKANINKKISKMKKVLEDARLQMKTSMEELANSQSNLDTLKLQYSKTGDKMQQMIIMTKINLVTNEINKYKSSIETYNATVIKTTTIVQDLVSGQATINKQEEITKLESEVNKIMIEAMFTLSRLPLIQAEYESSGSSTTMTSVSHYCGVIQGMSIKGDIGGSSTSTSTSTTSDISTQIIEKEEYAEKMEEEYTKIKEVAIIQKEEIYESIISDTKVIEETEKIISDSKTKLTELRVKEKEINTKITSATESSEIETYKHELTSITSQITTIKNIIKVQTQKKTQYTSKVTDSKIKIKEIEERVESTHSDFNNARDEALNYISEGIEATYVVQKKHESEKYKNILKVKEVEYKEKKTKYEEETTKITKIINEKIIKEESYKNEISDITKKIESDEKRITSITKEEEKKVVDQEIINLKAEMERYKKYLLEVTGEIVKEKTNKQNITNVYNNYHQNYTTIRAETYNSEEESKEYERYTSNRRRHRNHKNVHITKINSHKKKAETHRHATEETKKKVDKQKKHFKSQRYNLRCERSRHEHNSKTYTKEVTIEEKKIVVLREKLTTIKDESERIKIQDEISSLEASIETYKNNIKTEISKMHKNEEEESTISTKITNLEETVKKLESETTKIEEESKIVEESTSSETAKKVTEEVKKRKEVKETIKKTSLKEKIKKLTKIVEEKEKKVEENTKKIIEETKKISTSVTNMNRFSNINMRQRNIHQYASCQRLLIQEPSYFDLTTICQTAMFSGMNGMTQANGFNNFAGGRALTAQSQQCQQCYSLNPSCSGGGSTAGISVVSFSADTQGEADDLVNQLFNENMIADVNFLSSMVNRKFSLYGQVTSDPSQVKVELVTSDGKASQVVGRISQWKQQMGKQVGGMGNDAVITQLTGGSQEYIQFVMRQTSASVTQQPQMMMRGGMGGGMMGGGMMGGGMMGGMGGGYSSMSYTSSPMMRMSQQGEESGSDESNEDGSKPAENNKIETMSSFVSGFY